MHFLEKELVTQGYISSSDFYLFERVESVDDAIARIRRFYTRYHSLRYVGERLVLRLTSSIKDKEVDVLRREFQDLLTPQGAIILSGPLQEESDEPELAHLPRIVLDFNRRDFGRLRKLIDSINVFS
jgi:hypothetical protein